MMVEKVIVKWLNIEPNAESIENIRLIVDNARSQSVVCDVPQTSDGGETGPTTLELALNSLARCAVTIHADVAKKSGVVLSKLGVTAEAEKFVDSTKQSEVNMKVHVEGKAKKKLLEAMWGRKEANCLVMFIFEEPVHVKTALETYI
jgi:uncharacterized OsmC-like protein